MAVKLFYLDNLTSLDKLNLLLNLPTIPQDKEVELDIKLKIHQHTIIKVKVPLLYITGKLEPVRRQYGRLRKNTLLVQTVADILEGDQRFI